MKNKKILITGHKGFVGRHFMKKLDGNDITGIDIVGDNPIDARDFFRKNDTHYDLVIHLAAVVGGRAKIEGEPLSVAVDLAIDSEAFQWALRTKPKHFVYYSSSAAYPVYLQTGSYPYANHRLQESDIDLNEIETPDLTYGWSKLTGEMLANYAKKEGLRIHVFRPFSGYGEDQDLDYPFPSFIARAKRKDNPFEVWGNGEQARDWIHIEDVVDATMEAVNQNIQGPINLCNGMGVDFNNLARMVMKQAGYNGQLDYKLSAPKGVNFRVGDPTKMNTFYKSKITLEEGIYRSLRK